MANYASDLDLIKTTMGKLYAGTKAESILLLDTSGRLICHHGYDFGDTLPGISRSMLDIWSLAAALTPESGGLCSLQLKYEESQVYLVNVTDRVALAVIFKPQSAIGLVQLQCDKAICHMGLAFESIFSKVRRDKSLNSTGNILEDSTRGFALSAIATDLFDSQFEQDATQVISDLFNESKD